MQGGNRHARRVAASPKVSMELLQRRVIELERENQTYRDLLFAIVKEAGRVRVAKVTLAGLSQGDLINPRDAGDSWMIEYSQSNMVVPGGVADGKPGAA